MKRGCVPGAQPWPSRPPTGELHNRAGQEDGARNWGPLFAHLSRRQQSLRRAAADSVRTGWTPGLSVSGAGARTTPETDTQTP